MAVTDDTGSVAERYAYSPYGEVNVLDADFSADADGLSNIGNEYLYTGRRLDPETGLQLNRNRFYHQQLGRWVSRDPIGYADFTNLYLYVLSNPTASLDANGLLGHIAGGALLGCAGGATWSIGYSLITGDSFCQGCCKAGVSCLFGALGGALAAAAPTYAGCISGVVTGIAESATIQVCNYACGDGDNADVTCAVATALINGALGCVVKGGAPKEQEKLVKYLWQLVGRIVGYDIYAICHAVKGGPDPVDTCVERCGERFHWILDRRLYLLCVESCES